MHRRYLFGRMGRNRRRILYHLYREMPRGQQSVHLIDDLPFGIFCSSHGQGALRPIRSFHVRHVPLREKLRRRVKNPPEIRGDFYARDYFAAGFCDSCEASGAAVF